MFKLVIQDDEGKMTVVPLIRDEITIGRKEGNTIRLTERNVSRRHARILRNNGEVHIEDLGSYNGIRVNNARIAERVSLRVSDQVQIGDYKLYLKAEGLEQADEGHTLPLERVDSQIPTDAMAVVPPPGNTAPHGIPTPPPQMVGSPNRTMVAISDTDPTQRTVGPATAAAVAAMNATGTGYGRLVVVSSNFAGKEFELSRPQMIIGRTDENDIVVAHRSISRNHAKLVREPETGRYTISDLQSSNGVRVNGQDYGKVELRRGDVVDLGHVRLRFIEAGEDFVFARDAVITDVPEAGSRRGLLVALLAAVVVVAVAGVVMYSMHGSEKPSDGDTIAPGPGTTSGSFMGGSGSDVVAAAPEPTNPGSAAASNPPPTNSPGAIAAKAEDIKPKLAECTELVTQKKWQQLDDCAAELDVLGAKDKSTEFHDKAVRETQNDKRNDEITKALGVGNLRLAQATLKQMGEDSVYYKAQHDAFLKAEAPVVEATKRQALAYVKAHDCQTLRRYAVQQRDSSTAAVAAAASGQIAACTTPTAAIERPAPPPPSNPNPVTTPTPPPTPPPTPTNNACATMNVEDAMSQAANQYSAGYAKAALALVVKALQCKQEIRMYRMAAMYACGARDLQTAKTYFFKLPTNLQSGIEQKCQQENLNLRAP